MRMQEGYVVAQKYTLKRDISRGGIGCVWIAEHAALGTRVALKVLDGTATANQIGRFKREAQAAARLRSNSRKWRPEDMASGLSHDG